MCARVRVAGGYVQVTFSSALSPPFQGSSWQVCSTLRQNPVSFSPNIYLPTSGPYSVHHLPETSSSWKAQVLNQAWGVGSNADIDHLLTFKQMIPSNSSHFYFYNDNPAQLSSGIFGYFKRNPNISIIKAPLLQKVPNKYPFSFHTPTGSITLKFILHYKTQFHQA